MNQQVNTVTTASAGLSEIDAAELKAIERYRRAVNYLAAAQIYLKDNPLLDEPLCSDHFQTAPKGRAI